ncbi:cytochrome b/b6 domain-containing protein [Puniceibacterium sp. IMCC21224]|uniref:cytochrome b/b6 domain-containing protein n=1 Tax=Puniceibacterium sp. IMCC21224 TaxID=1618204 RepID=UPI00064E10CA|nr:cytochrome b/b6 domain-containing protein [Puniceibacterium sp. IMCC21224]KMK67016.1 cytochrome B561 [Puniceibacterium sp. IMCC21224]
MPLTNTTTRYGGVAKTLHWLTALGILLAIPLGLFANDAPFSNSEELATKALLFSLHKTLGVTIFLIAVLRILWALIQPKPAPLHPERRLESFLGETVHWLLYGSLILVPLTGWIHHAATTGFAPIWMPFGQSLPFVPKSQGVADATAALHIIFERVLLIALGLHIAGALKHHFIDRDATLRRMWPGSTTAGDPRQRHRGLVPMLSAVVMWVAALGVGAGLGAFQHKATAAQVAILDDAQGNWHVEDGTLALSVRQFGSEVTGQFADWTADIRFTQQDAPGKTGTVSVTVAIGSLTLGSVSAQAMGPDFFDADQFPTATFTADLIKSADGYVTDGILRLKGAEVPVSLPFQLHIDGDTAAMQGQVSLDRRDFAVGTSMSDESQLGFSVALDIALTAIRTSD